MTKEDATCPHRSSFYTHLIPRIPTPLLSPSIHLCIALGLYLSGAACVTNVRVCGETSSAPEGTGDRALAGGRALGEVGGAFRVIPQVRHSQRSHPLTALCPLGHRSTQTWGGAGGCRILSLPSLLYFCSCCSGVAWVVIFTAGLDDGTVCAATLSTAGRDAGVVWAVVFSCQVSFILSKGKECMR